MKKLLIFSFLCFCVLGLLSCSKQGNFYYIDLDPRVQIEMPDSITVQKFRVDKTVKSWTHAVYNNEDVRYTWLLGEYVSKNKVPFKDKGYDHILTCRDLPYEKPGLAEIIALIMVIIVGIWIGSQD